MTDLLEPTTNGTEAEVRLPIHGGQVEIRDALLLGARLTTADVENTKALGNARQSLLKWGIPVKSDYSTGRTAYYVPGAPSERFTEMIEAAQQRARAARSTGAKRGRPKGAKNKDTVDLKARLAAKHPVDFHAGMLNLGETLTVVAIELTDEGDRRVRLRAEGGEVVFIGPNP